MARSSSARRRAANATHGAAGFFKPRQTTASNVSRDSAGAPDRSDFGTAIARVGTGRSGDGGGVGCISGEGLRGTDGGGGLGAFADARRSEDDRLIALAACCTSGDGSTAATFGALGPPEGSGLGAFGAPGEAEGSGGGLGALGEAACILARAMTASQSPSLAAGAGDGRALTSTGRMGTSAHVSVATSARARAGFTRVR